MFKDGTLIEYDASCQYFKMSEKLKRVKKMMMGFFLLQGTCSLHEERCRGGSETSQEQYDTTRPLKLVFSICRIGTCHPHCFIQQQDTNGETLTTVKNHTKAGSGSFTIGDEEYPVLPGFTAPPHRAL